MSFHFFQVGVIHREGIGDTDTLAVVKSNPLSSLIFMLNVAILESANPGKERIVVIFLLLRPCYRLPGLGRSVQMLGKFTAIVVDVHRAP